MGTELDFSFPTHNLPSSSIDSPPLWRSSPAAASTDDKCSRHHEQEEIVEDHPPQRESFSFMEDCGGDKMGILEKEESCSDIHEDEEMIKMDMLWEDLNDEKLSRSSSSTSGDEDQMLQLGCVQALKLSKANKKPGGVVVIIKVLKRLFFLHSSRHKLKKPAESAW